MAGGANVNFDGLIVDLDGVVWIGEEPVPGSAAALAELRARGVALVFLTNDPSRSRADYAARLMQIGVKATEAEIVTSGSALASLIRDREGAGTTAFVIGSRSLKSELERVGLQLCDGEAGREAEVVAVGGHTNFNYDELCIAAQAVCRGASLYAAGRDATFPMPDGPWPATGSILAAVETAAGTRAIVAGKPEAHIFEIARSLLADCRRVAIVGDHLEADIAGGKRAGLTTILVLTGTTSRERLEAAEVEPDVVLEDLAGLVARPVAPIPKDDGAVAHVAGQEIPALALASTQGLLELAELARERLVLYIYPRTGIPGEPPLPGWDQIPGARGCTAQSCAFRDHHGALAAFGAGVAGLSAQSHDEQREFAARNQMPFPLLSDPELRLAAALGLPTFTAGGLVLYRRITLVAEAGKVVNVFYPVFPPEGNARDVVAWLESHLAQAASSER